MKNSPLKTYKVIHNYQYNLSAILGKGSFGTVYQATNMLTGQIVAVKVIDRKLIAKEDARVQVELETQIMKKFQHENIVKLIDVLDTANNKYIVSEYCNGSDLKEYLQQKKQNIININRFLKEVEAIPILKDIIAGLKEMVAQSIIHRDLKPANIIRHNQKFKITDFGFSRQFDRVEMMQSLVGTPLYMAPQILLKQNYSNKCDIWSLGMLYYEILYGTTPWTATTIEELIKNLGTQPLTFPSNKNVSIQSKQFLRQCLRIEEKQRYDWDQIFNHPLMSSPKSQLVVNDPILKQKITARQQVQSDHQTQMKNDKKILPALVCNQRERSNSSQYVRLKTPKYQAAKDKFEEIISYGSSQSTVQNSQSNQVKVGKVNERKLETQRSSSHTRDQEFYVPLPKTRQVYDIMRRTKSQLDYLPSRSDVDIYTIQRVLTSKCPNQSKHHRNLKNIFDQTPKIIVKNRYNGSFNNNIEDNSKTLVMRLISKLEQSVISVAGVRKIETLNLLITHRTMLQQTLQSFEFFWETASKTMIDLIRQLKIVDNENAKLTMILLEPYQRVLEHHKLCREANKKMVLDLDLQQEIESVIRNNGDSSKENHTKKYQIKLK